MKFSAMDAYGDYRFKWHQSNGKAQAQEIENWPLDELYHRRGKRVWEIRWRGGDHWNNDEGK